MANKYKVLFDVEGSALYMTIFSRNFVENNTHILGMSVLDTAKLPECLGWFVSDITSDAMCCGISNLGSFEYEYGRHFKDFNAFAAVLQQGFRQWLERAQISFFDNKSYEYRVGKITANDAVGGPVDKLCRAMKWYCSPYPSRNPKTNNLLMIYEFGLDHSDRV